MRLTCSNAKKNNIILGTPQYTKQQGSNSLQNVVKLYNHFLFVVKNFYSVMVLC